MPTFNGETLIITLDAVVDGVLNIDWEDTYSAWKDWSLEGTNLKYPQAFITTGGDPINTILDSGSYFFLRNDLGWRIRPYENDGTYYAAGNLTGQDATYPIFVPTLGAYTVGILGLQPVTQAISADIIAQSVWDEPITGHLVAETTGHQLYHQAYDNTVHVDTVNGTAGTAFPAGTTHQPCDNLDDALTIATTHFMPLIHVVGDLVIDGQDLTGRTIGADSSVGNSITITSMVNTGICYFEDLTVSGALSGGTRFTTCVLGALTGFDGGAKNCLLTGDIIITGSGTNYFTECDTYVTSMTPKDISIGANYLNLIKFRGNLSLSDYTGSATIAADFVAGICTVNSTCVSGSMGISGICELIDNSGVGCTIMDKTVTEEGITDAVWSDPDATTTLEILNFLQKIVKNKREITAGKSLVVYDDDELTSILTKALSDKDGSAITDLASGVLAREGATSV